MIIEMNLLTFQLRNCSKQGQESPLARGRSVDKGALIGPFPANMLQNTKVQLALAQGRFTVVNRTFEELQEEAPTSPEKKSKPDKAKSEKKQKNFGPGESGRSDEGESR